ncbi:MAG: formate/nitrite transporter [Acidobacteria bacterium]|nr:formate/nitrite transporter [Acidobacteriota bacterium]
MSQTDSIKLAVPVNERDHVMGPANAAVTLVNYGDYQCPGCQQRHRSTEKMARELLDRVRLVHRHFPLVKSHPRALRAAEAAEAAAAQGKFWEMHRLLYLHPDKLRDRDLHRYGNEVGLDLERFDREMASGIYAEQILKDFSFSLNHGITGTPTTFINGVRYAMSAVELVMAVKACLNEREGYE